MNKGKDEDKAVARVTDTRVAKLLLWRFVREDAKTSGSALRLRRPTGESGKRCGQFTHIQMQDIKTLTKNLCSFICGRHGAENEASFIVHSDKINPYIYCILLPIRNVRNANIKNLCGKEKDKFPAGKRNMNNQFAEKNEKREMTKGSFFYTIAKHRSTASTKRNLSPKFGIIEQTIEEFGRTFISFKWRCVRLSYW
ncbi:MAG: plasmid recombination protein [Prevotella sp.]|nr:plasmid recombination protein [Prevotella sp.]